jgi:D-alanyl-D-alanine carboxypeptidase/D-alanyl-D-alanine-endopeptidase (penicillin-binding protein 4)
VLSGREPGQPAVLELPAPTGYPTVDSLVRIVGEGPTDVSVDRNRGPNRVRLRGTVRAGQTAAQTIAVDNPTRLAAFALREALLARGITVHGSARDRDEVAGPLPGEERVVFTHRSPQLDEMLMVLNKVSQNLYAEQLLRVAALRAGGRGDTGSAAQHAKSVLQGLGVDTNGMVIADGSGLTRLNLVRPRQLAALLAGIHRSEHRELFVATLPIAGVDGTLEGRFQDKDNPARGRAWAKTGYISRVVALSGYVPRPDPAAAPLVFSILINNFTCSSDQAKAAVDTFVGALASAVGWPAPSGDANR